MCMTTVLYDHLVPNSLTHSLTHSRDLRLIPLVVLVVLVVCLCPAGYFGWPSSCYFDLC